MTKTSDQSVPTFAEGMSRIVAEMEEVLEKLKGVQMALDRLQTDAERIS